jgi:Zn-dependent peptidase ImmA (M78 family)/transcriptional regulator with XRE-family HTH domain
VPQSPPAFVTPSALRWARESIGYELEEAAERIGVSAEKLAAAERGEAYLTLRQAEEAARRYERPLAALFVSEPPVEETPEAQFRRLPGAPAPPWPREMRALAKRIRGRQAAAVDLYDALDDDPPWPAVAIDYVEDPEALAVRAREALGIALDEQRQWRDRSGYLPLRAWVDAIESLGVLVMQDGSLPVSDLRGFASSHVLVPAIVVNTNDDPRARAFTAVHELGHLLRIRAGRPTGPTTEQWCNDFASGVLMPGEPFARDLREAGRGQHLLEAVDDTALVYGVTAYAAAVRTARLQLAPRGEIDAVIEEIQERYRRQDEEAPEGGGGNYYLTTVTRLGPSFIQLVFSALDRQAVSYPAAAGLLGVKVNNFDRLRERAQARGADR